MGVVPVAPNSLDQQKHVRMSVPIGQDLLPLSRFQMKPQSKRNMSCQYVKPQQVHLEACFTVRLSPWSSELSSSLPLRRHDIFHPALNLHGRPRKGSTFQNKSLLSATVNIFESSTSWKMHGHLTHNFASGNMWLLRWSPTGSLRINLHDISFSTL